MPYEIAHDNMARQVYEKASTEARTRRKVERYVREHYMAYQERGVQLTQDDLDYIRPYLGVINVNDDQLTYLVEGEKRLRWHRQRRRILWGTITAIFAITAFWALRQSNEAKTREAETVSMRIALAARYAMFEGKPTLAFRLAEQALWQNQDQQATAIAFEILEELQSSPVEREIRHQDSITVLQFSHDGESFISGALDGEVRWTNLSGEVLASFQYANPVVWGALLGLTEKLVVQTSNNEFYIQDLGSGATSSSFSGGETVQAVNVLRHRALLAIASSKTVTVWDLQDAPQKLLQLPFVTAPSALVLVEKNEGWELLTANRKGEAFRWNKEGDLIGTYSNILQQPITGVSVNQTADKVLFHTVVGDFITSYEGATLGTLAASLFQAYRPHKSAFSGRKEKDRAVGFSLDSTTVFSFNFSGGDIDMDWRYIPREKPIFCMLSPDALTVVVCDGTYETVVYRLRDKLAMDNQTLFRFSNQTRWGVFSPDNGHFLSSAGGHSALLFMFDLEFVREKSAVNLETIFTYYNQRFESLTSAERSIYGIP